MKVCPVYQVLGPISIETPELGKITLRKVLLQLNISMY